MQYPLAVQHVMTSLMQLPGIGEKTALRMVMSMMKWEENNIQTCSKSISELSRINYCTECGIFSEEKVCHICLNEGRISSEIICVVENINDLIAIENSGEYRGLYHILGGVLNPLSGIGPEQLRISKLVERVIKLEIKTMILAVGPSVEGDATCAFLRNILSRNPETQKVNVERIGFGVPMGGNLELLDPMTIAKALENRTLMG